MVSATVGGGCAGAGDRDGCDRHGRGLWIFRDRTQCRKRCFDRARQVIAYRTLVKAFYKLHDPTQVNRQGPDVGSQYRSGIWTVSDAQATVANEVTKELEKSNKFKSKIATQIESAKTFFIAEDAHQDYIEKTGRACHVTNPWK